MQRRRAANSGSGTPIGDIGAVQILVRGGFASLVRGSRRQGAPGPHVSLHQVRQIGVLGLIGYVVLGVGYLAIFGVQVVGVFVLPSLAASQPGYVNDVLAVATNGTPIGDVGAVQILVRGGFAYIVGGLIFGIALFRANVLARWAAVLLSVGAVATVATSQLPELTQRLFAIPVGVAMIGLGYSLWRTTRTEHVDATIGAKVVIAFS